MFKRENKHWSKTENKVKREEEMWEICFIWLFWIICRLKFNLFTGFFSARWRSANTYKRCHHRKWWIEKLTLTDTDPYEYSNRQHAANFYISCKLHGKNINLLFHVRFQIDWAKKNSHLQHDTIRRHALQLIHSQSVSQSVSHSLNRKWFDVLIYNCLVKVDSCWLYASQNHKTNYLTTINPSWENFSLVRMQNKIMLWWWSRQCILFYIRMLYIKIYCNFVWKRRRRKKFPMKSNLLEQLFFNRAILWSWFTQIRSLLV